MAQESSEQLQTPTGPLNYDTAQDVSILEHLVEFRPAPDTKPMKDRPVWKVRFDLVDDPTQAFGLDLNGEVILGREPKPDPAYVDLSRFHADEMGVSRQHAMLRPTGTKLYLIDLGSTNGSYRNGYSIGVKTPYGISNGDVIALGRLQLVVRIIERPSGHTTMIAQKATLADALAQTAKAITSQLRLEEVLNQVAESAIGLVNAGEIGIWLVDPASGELFLEAERGIQDESIKLMRLPATGDSFAAQVIRSGLPVRAQREPGSDQIKIKTDYLAEAVLFVPIVLADETIGVISAVHREQGKLFEERDEGLLATIADFAAIAVQNSRAYQVTDAALTRRVKELATLNDLSNAVNASLDLQTVYNVLLEQVSKHWKVEAAALWLVDAGSGTVFPYAPKTDQPGEGEQFAVGRGIVGRVAESGHPEVVNEVQTDARYDANVDTSSEVVIKAVNMACVPLLTAGQVVGVLVLFNKQEGKFSDPDLQQLQQFANPVATAIQNARLFEDARRERATVLATASTIPQPLLILSEDGDIIIANQAANRLLASNMSQVFDGLSRGIGGTTEIVVGDETYITTSYHQEGVGTIIMMQDITYVKQLEKTRTEFIHALSHDLKSPLTSIKGWTFLLQSHGSLTEQAAKFVGQIGNAADRMMEMVSQLLTTAMSSRGPHTQQEACDLVKLCDDAVKDLQGAALAKSIELNFKQMGDPMPVKGDCQHLYRAVLNLVDNAIKYSPENTAVWVALTYWGNNVTVQVRDDGPGIPAGDLPHVFEKGFRGVQIDGPEKGVGLGLATVKTIVQTHGGTVNVENVAGHGAEFTISLPVG